MMIMTDQYIDGLTLNSYLEGWKRWDGSAYIDIAQYGYGHYQENGQHLYLVFWPLYAWLVRCLSFVFNNYMLSALIASTILYSVGTVYFYLLLEDEFDESVARYSVIAISIYPFAFYYGAMMTESLFFAISAAFFYYLYKHNYLLVTFLGFLACLTKVQGALLSFAILFELALSSKVLTRLKNKDIKGIWTEFIYPGIKCVPMLFGIFLYMLINYLVDGSPIVFLTYQKEHWGNTLCPMWKTIKYVSEYAFNNRFNSTGLCMWIPEFLLFFVFILVIAYSVRSKLRIPYIAYLTVFFIITYSSTWLISGARYSLSALPLFICEGIFLNKHPKIRVIVYSLSMGLMIVYMNAYFSWKQIM